jgi:hypothetical protein
LAAVWEDSVADSVGSAVWAADSVAWAEVLTRSAVDLEVWAEVLIHLEEWVANSAAWVGAIHLHSAAEEAALAADSAADLIQI